MNAFSEKAAPSPGRTSWLSRFCFPKNVKPMVSVAEKVEWLAEANHTPVSVHFELTHRCNLRCLHCYLSDDEGEELSSREVESVLDQLSEAGCLFLIFTGGEIFLRDDLLDILRAAEKRGFAFTLFTNGTLIDDRTADQIDLLSPLGVEISIYGEDAQTHDRVTGARGSFSRSVRAIRLLRERGIRVTLKCPLMKENLGEYMGVVSLAQSLGAGCRLDPIITPKNDGSTDPLSHRMGRRDLMGALHHLGLYPKAPRFIEPDGRELLCNAGVTNCCISPYGDVYPCIQLLISVGNLREESFQKIWGESELLSELKGLKNSDLTACRTCSFSSYCNRCPGLALLEDGDLLGPCTASCQLAELREKLAQGGTSSLAPSGVGQLQSDKW